MIRFITDVIVVTIFTWLLYEISLILEHNLIFIFFLFSIAYMTLSNVNGDKDDRINNLAYDLEREIEELKNDLYYHQQDLQEAMEKIESLEEKLNTD